MPNIQQYTRQILPRANIETRAVQDQTIPNAIGTLAGVTNKVSEVLREHKEKKEERSFWEDYNSRMTVIDNSTEEWSNADYDQNEAGLSGVFSAGYAKAMDGIKVPEHMSDWWSKQSAEDRRKYSNVGKDIQAQREGIKAKALWEQSSSLYSKAIDNGTMSVEEAKTKISKLSESFNIFPEERNAMVSSEVSNFEKISEAAGKRRHSEFIMNNPETVLQNPDKFSNEDVDAAARYLTGKVNRERLRTQASEYLGNHGKVNALIKGEGTQEDLESVRGSLDEPTYKNLTKRHFGDEKIPDPSNAEKLKARMEIDAARDALLDLKNEDGSYEVTPETIKAVSNFRDIVFKKASNKLITTDRAGSYINEELESLNNAISSYQTEGETAWFPYASGIKSPTDWAIDHLSNTMNINTTAKREVLNEMYKYIGDYQSTGSLGKDKEIVQKIINRAINDYAEKQMPSLTGKTGRPNIAISKSGDAISLTNEPDAKAEKSIIVPTERLASKYKTKEDIGNAYSRGEIDRATAKAILNEMMK